MRRLTKEEKLLWDKVCASVNKKSHRCKITLINDSPDTPVGNLLDLHGHTESSAYSSISQLLAMNHQSGHKKVTIITGKGKGGPGILRRLVPFWLQSSLKSYVKSFHFDPKNNGQLIVILK